MYWYTQLAMTNCKAAVTAVCMFKWPSEAMKADRSTVRAVTATLMKQSNHPLLLPQICAAVT